MSVREQSKVLKVSTWHLIFQPHLEGQDMLKTKLQINPSLVFQWYWELKKIANLFKYMSVYEQTHLGATNYIRIEYMHTTLTRNQNTILPCEDHIT